MSEEKLSFLNGNEFNPSGNVLVYNILDKNSEKIPEHIRREIRSDGLINILYASRDKDSFNNFSKRIDYFVFGCFSQLNTSKILKRQLMQHITRELKNNGSIIPNAYSLLTPAVSEDNIMACEDDIIFADIHEDPSKIQESLYDTTMNYFKNYDFRQKETYKGFPGNKFKEELERLVDFLIAGHQEKNADAIELGQKRLRRFCKQKRPFTDYITKIIHISKYTNFECSQEVVSEYVKIIAAVHLDELLGASRHRDKIWELEEKYRIPPLTEKRFINETTSVQL